MRSFFFYGSSELKGMGKDGRAHTSLAGLAISEKAGTDILAVLEGE